MKPPKTPTPPNPAIFLKEAVGLATHFGWQTRTFEREQETVCVAAIPGDPSFNRFVWVYDAERAMLRCMMVAKQEVPQRREGAILELCARVNEGLPFGCLEYSFGDRVLVFRDSADLDWGPVNKVIGGVTARVLNLGQRYAGAIRSTLDGERPEDAVGAN